MIAAQWVLQVPMATEAANAETNGFIRIFLTLIGNGLALCRFWLKQPSGG
jgi:hypothetical protein